MKRFLVFLEDDNSLFVNANSSNEAIEIFLSTLKRNITCEQLNVNVSEEKTGLFFP